ncbi:MAG TPA: TetR/AcrR family transcriptional regulator [Acidimicrobiales bacterium]|nr:TetR/AcrR family transcriptional regulator [Acidimicrobiales bacterium]
MAKSASEPAPVIDRSAGFERKRRDILRGAALVFYRRGFAAGTTKEIAAEVGLSQPAIYHYVGSKDDLLRQIALQVDHDILASLDAADPDAPPAAQLRAIIGAFVAAVIENQETFAVYWKELDSSFPEDLRAAVTKDEKAFMARISKLVKQLQDDGTFPSDAPTTIVTEGVVGMVCWMYHWYRPGRTLDPAGVADVFCNLIGLPEAP